MAWFGEGFSSLKGQLSNLAKNVLVDEDETPRSTEAGGPASSSNPVNSSQAPFGWSEAEEGVFIGQENYEKQKEELPQKLASNQSQLNKNADGDGGTIIPKGITNLFHQIGDAASQHIALNRNAVKKDAETQTNTDLPATSDATFLQLSQHNAELRSEVESLRRVVRDLESQIATSQDENANLSTGLEELDIHHQEAIERVLTVKDEALKELEQVKELMSQREADFRRLEERNQAFLKEIEMLNLDIQGSETLSQENAELREKLSELMKGELPSIPEQSAAEEHVRTLEAEAAALRESRDNLERETATLLSQLRQRDATLREADAKLEKVSAEKKVKEREMTHIVFECNSLREELKIASDNIAVLERDRVELRDEISSLKSKLQQSLEINTVKNIKLENTKREICLANDEIVTLKSELESLKKKRTDGKANSGVVIEHPEEANKVLVEESQKVEALCQRIDELEESLAESCRDGEVRRKQLTEELEASQRELSKLRDLASEYTIQQDHFRKNEAKLKEQLLDASVKLGSITSQLTFVQQEADHLRQLNSNLVQEENSKSLNEENKKEISRLRSVISKITTEKETLAREVAELQQHVKKLKSEIESKAKDLLIAKSTVQTSQSDVGSYRNTIRLLESEIVDLKKQVRQNEIGKTSAETQTYSSEEKEKETLIIESLSEEIEEFKSEKLELLSQQQLINDEKFKLEESLKLLTDEKNTISQEKQTLEKANNTLLLELGSATKKIEQLSKELSDIRLESSKISHEEIIQLKHQTDHLKDELKEIYDEREHLASQLEKISGDKEVLLTQVNALRGELNTIPILKQELELVKTTLKDKNSEACLAQNEIRRLDNALSVQLKSNETLYNEKNELFQKNEHLLVQMQRKMANMEEMEGIKTKEIESLKQEVDNLKTQLEYASQLLQDVERQEGEGQPSGEQMPQKTTPEQQEELSRLSASLLKEQTEKKILQNLLSERDERLEKTETQLQRLKKHLVEVEESYCLELSTAEEKLQEMQVQLTAAEERARTSTSAYTSASIRSNQQVEALREQVRLLTEHKEKLEQQISLSEDIAAKQAAAVTRLQAVLHQFQLDKQKDIDFETARIRRDLSTAEKKNEDLQKDLKLLQEQLEDAKEGLVATQRLSEQLVHQSETITQLKLEIFELNEKLQKKEEKVNDLNSENKVDRQLVTNLLVGFVTSPTESKMKVLGVLGQVLSLTKEERQKVGLEPGGRQQTLSEAFIKFLQSESQPRPEVFLPLGSTSSLPPSRKSSILAPEIPVLLPHFPVGKNPGSILKDVLQDRRPE